MKKKITVVVSMLCFVVLLVLVYLYTQHSRKIPENDANTVGNTAGNLYNGGYFCENDGYVYFSNPYDNYALYRMLPDETNMEKLVTTQTKSINAAGKYIYYYQFGSGSGVGLGYVIDMTGIYRAEKKNAAKASCLSRTHLDTMLLVGNNLYYDNNNSTSVTFTKIGIDGKNFTTLANRKITPASFSNGSLYFNNTVEDFHLNRLDLTTDRISDVYSEDVYTPIVDGSEVFYIDIHNNYALVKYNLTTNEKTILDDSTRTDMFNLSSNYVYYQTSGDVIQFRRIPRNGGSMEVIADGAYNTINLTSRYVYFKKYQAEVPVYKIPLDGPIYITTFDEAKAAAEKNMQK